MERAFLLWEAQLKQRCKLMVAWAQKGGKGVVGAGKNAWALYLLQANPKHLEVHEETVHERPSSRM